MHKYSLLLAIAASCLTCSVTSIAAEQPDWPWVATISAGPIWENAGASQTLVLAPDIEKTYAATKSTKTLFDGEVFIGRQRMLSQTFQGQIGLAAADTSSAKLSGSIWDDANPQFNNFTYSYKIKHTHIAFKGKLLADIGFCVLPWISTSLGVGFNLAHSFNNTPVLFQALPTPIFSSHTQTAFTYTIGAGVQKILNPHWQVGVGYEFADWGQSHLGIAAGQTTGHGLSLNHLYTNELQFNLTWVS